MKDNENTFLTNGHILEILEETAREWARGRSEEKVTPVVDYLNFLVYSWMGGNWGLSVEHVLHADSSETLPKHP